MSGQGLISECLMSSLPVEGIGLDADTAPALRACAAPG
jgi:hypothetical protein